MTEDLFHHALRIAEAMLFASPTPLSEAALGAKLPGAVPASAVLSRLAADYACRGVNLVEVAGGWTFRTAPELAAHLASEAVVSRKLSRAQIETLAIIAYHQPVTRAEIEEIRGVALHKGTLDLLMAAGWVQPKGRRETPGRPVTWVTTEAFLLHFGLSATTDLPRLEELKAAGLLDARPVQTLGDGPAADGDSADPAPEEL